MQTTCRPHADHMQCDIRITHTIVCFLQCVTVVVEAPIRIAPQLGVSARVVSMPAVETALTAVLAPMGSPQKAAVVGLSVVVCGLCTEILCVLCSLQL